MTVRDIKNNIDSVENLKAATVNGKAVESALTDLIASIGENMTLGRAAELSVNNGVVASYVHNAVFDGLDRCPDTRRGAAVDAAIAAAAWSCVE